MDTSVLTRLPVVRASRLVTEPAQPTNGLFSLANLSGRLTQIVNTPSAPAVSAVFFIVAEAVTSKEPLIWINQSNIVFFPPDLERMGIPPSLVPIVRSRDTRGTLRSIEHVLRSGAYGLVVVNTGGSFSVAQGRLGTFARLVDMHGTALIFITEEDEDRAPSLGSGISLQCSVRLKKTGANTFGVRITAVKDKNRSPGWAETKTCYGPPGLC